MEAEKTGFDAHLHCRIPADLLPRLHAVARSHGLTAASFTRMAVLDALSRAEYRQPEAA